MPYVWRRERIPVFFSSHSRTFADHDRTSRAPVALVCTECPEKAQENHNITSETGLRHYLLECFLVPADILSSVVSLAKSWRKSIDRKRSQYSHHRNAEYALLSSATVGECPLFRFRAALGNYRKQAGAHMSAHGLRGCSMIH